MDCSDCDNCGDCDDLQLSSGQDGQDVYLYIGYADDTSGSNFTTDPSKDRKYISLVKTTTKKTNDKSLHNNEGEWKKYIGDNGSSAGGAQILYNDNTTQSTSNSNYTQLQTFTVSSGKLSTNGDALRIKTAIRQPSSEEAQLELRIWESSATSTFYTKKVNHFFLPANDEEGILDVQLNRVDNTSASADTAFQTVGGDRYQVNSNVRFFDRDSKLNSPLDFDSQGLEIEVFLQTTGGTVYCDHLSIEYIPKS